jgi:hypothetical protein
MTLDDRAVKEKKGKIFGKGQKRDDLDQPFVFWRFDRCQALNLFV